MATSDAANAAPLLPSARDYQQEMLQQSLQRNIVVAMDTGSGKTLIAVLRIKAFLESEGNKVAWFITPTVMLCEQQKDVLDNFLAVDVAMISGALEPNSWKDPVLWEATLKHRLVVSTPQVLLDAMHHGYVNMGQHIGLIVFDEAHHAADKHPYNLIMKNFYFDLPSRTSQLSNSSKMERPVILGLTASPTFGTDIERDFRTIESNLDSVILAPQLNVQEYLRHAHRPIFKHLLYRLPEDRDGAYSSKNLRSLQDVIATLDIDIDPYVKNLRKQLGRMTESDPLRARIDQKLSKAIKKHDTYTHKGLRDFQRAAEDICLDVGPWGADWYIEKVVARVKDSEVPYKNIIADWQQEEKRYMVDIIKRINIKPSSYNPPDIIAGITDKVLALIECLQEEKALTESAGDVYSCLVFVTRRDSVLALSEVLRVHPQTKNLFNIGSLLGSSESQYRRTFLDITRDLALASQVDTLRDFRIGEKNLIVSTSVAEEGIDIQACGTVIRWDPPQNMVSWAQSRGRARRKKSTFVLMFDQGSGTQDQIQRWEQLERDMTALYYREKNAAKEKAEEEDWDMGSDRVVCRVESTGATLTLDSAVPHLSHFCAVLPNGNHVPIYDDDPPEFPEGWHYSERREALQPYLGPFGAKVTLPRLLPHHLREFIVEREYPTKVAARQAVAANAYVALYNAGLLNEHLLPFTSVLEPDKEEEVKAMLQDVMSRAGTANVDLQMDPWVPIDTPGGGWKATVVEITGLPALRMFTQVGISTELTFTLYPRDRSPLEVRIIHNGEPQPDEDTLVVAQEWTRTMFWNAHSPRMSWDKLDFKYLFLPMVLPNDISVWNERRAWWKAIATERGNFRPALCLSAPLLLFAEAFDWPTNINYLIHRKEVPTHRFNSWVTDKASPEVEAELRNIAIERGTELSYPLITASPLPRRASFLSPSDEMEAASQHLLPQLTRVILSSQSEVDYALLLPSAIRHIAMTNTLHAFRTTIFQNTPLMVIKPDLLLVALTAPASQERNNYQRLETLGDCALKVIASVSLFALHPFWHEGYLSRRKDHMVSNAQLAVHAVRLEMYRWIIRDRFTPRKWKPAMENDRITALPLKPEGDVLDPKEAKKQKKQQLSTKLLADVMESCIGAAILSGGWDLAVECIKLFGLGASDWKTIPESVNMILERVEPMVDFPTQTTQIELIMGHTFKHKAYLVEAIMHSSSQTQFRTTSYERLEFLGDAVLDWIITDKLYHAPGKNYAPGHMHLRKSAVVNSHFLGYISLRSFVTEEGSLPSLDVNGAPILCPQQKNIHLFQCMLHSSTRVLADQENSFARYIKLADEIETALTSGKIFPWALFTRLQAPKFLGDIVEALLGAIWLDSEGNFDVIRGVLTKLGILPILDRIIAENVDVQHPVSRLGLWASRKHKKVEYQYEKSEGNVTCMVIVHHFTDKTMKEAEGEPSMILRVKTPDKGLRAEAEARFHAASEAVQKLEVQTIEQMMEEDLMLELDMDEDVPEDDE